jgi:hypothetical protein
MKNRRRKIMKRLMVIIIIIGGIGCGIRNEDWRDEKRLFESAEKVCPNSVKVLENMGILSRRYHHYNQSLSYFKKAQEIDSSHCDLHYQFALTFLSQGFFDQAIQSFFLSFNCPWVRHLSLQTIYHLSLSLSSSSSITTTTFSSSSFSSSSFSSFSSSSLQNIEKMNQNNNNDQKGKILWGKALFQFAQQIEKEAKNEKENEEYAKIRVKGLIELRDAAANLYFQNPSNMIESLSLFLQIKEYLHQLDPIIEKDLACSLQLYYWLAHLYTQFHHFHLALPYLQFVVSQCSPSLPSYHQAQQLLTQINSLQSSSK